MILLLLMAAILTSTIDSERAQSRYFLGYQLGWIRDDAKMRLWEKSFRIGATWADGFKNVRKRLLHKNRDYLFATKDYPSALEYMQACRQFCEVFKVGKGIVSQGEEIATVPVVRDGKDTGFVEDCKIAYIKFDSGSRIIAFSANPGAMIVYGGDVGLDEFSRHRQAEELYAVAQARVTWGYDLALWSAHNGIDSQFYVFAQQARSGKGGWSHHLTTIVDAINQGLVEKINATRGTTFTRESFLEDCKQRANALGPHIFDEAYMCSPQGSQSAIVPWATIELCMVKDAPLDRVHLESKEIPAIFGPFTPQRDDERDLARRKRIADWLRGRFAGVLREPFRARLGYDVAASGEGDLASIYIDREMPGYVQLAGLLTFRTEDWHFHEAALWFFLSHLSACRGSGDETGLGRQVCWRTAQQFPGQFVGVNFARDKHVMGAALMNRLSAAEKRWPKSALDVAGDYFALRKIHHGGKWHFIAGRNMHMPDSHCDIAWSGALSDQAADTGLGVTSALI